MFVLDSAYYEFGLVIWISGTYQDNLKQNSDFQSEIEELVKTFF